MYTASNSCKAAIKVSDTKRPPNFSKCPLASGNCEYTMSLDTPCSFMCLQYKGLYCLGIFYTRRAFHTTAYIHSPRLSLSDGLCHVTRVKPACQYIRNFCSLRESFPIKRYSSAATCALYVSIQQNTLGSRLIIRGGHFFHLKSGMHG